MNSDRNKDLEEHLVDYQTLMEINNENDKIRREVWIIIEQLTKEINALKLSEKQANAQLREQQENLENPSVTVLYTEIHEKFEALKVDYKNMNEKLLTEKKQLEEKFRSENNGLSQKLQLLTETIELQKDELQSKEQDYFNELQVSQAAAAMQLDEMESNYQSQISELHKKMWESNHSCNTLRAELSYAKNRQNFNNNVTDNKLRDLSEKLKFTEDQLRRTQEELFKVKRKNETTVIFKNQALPKNSDSAPSARPAPNQNLENAQNHAENVKYSSGGEASNKTSFNYAPKYETLNVCTSKSSLSKNSEGRGDAENFNENYKKLPGVAMSSYNAEMGQQSSNDRCTVNSYKTVVVPPLIQLSFPKMRLTKKRKLYNPNDVDFFEVFEQ